MPEKSLPAQALATLLEQTGRVLHGLGYASDLFPAQWSALRYFGRAEPQHRTASALARYQGLATGPVTRTVRTLIGKGLLVKAGSLGRGRSERIDLTTDPLSTVTAALEELSDSDRRGLASSLEIVLRRLQARHLEPHAPDRP
jgi:DNA-binding MarR family transcriptional regulator